MKKFVILILALLCFSCRREKEDTKHTDTFTTGVIAIAADESFAPIVQQELDVFESMYTGAGVVPKYVSEVEAINLLLRDSVRFAITTRRLTQKEKTYFESKKFFPKEIKIATDGIAIIVNKNNTDSLLSVNDLRKILTGKIRSWKSLDKSSKLDSLLLIFDNQNSSTVRYAIDSICKEDCFTGNLRAQKNNAEVIDFVANNPNAIGIIGASWIGNKSDSTQLSFNERVRVLAISRENMATPENSFKPYQAYLALGKYPLTRNVYIILNDPRGALASGLTSFMVSDKGQRIILKTGIVPATQTIRIVNINDDSN